MLTHYSNTTATDSSERVLDSLTVHANTAERICDRIEEFLSRCRGQELAQNAKSGISEVCTGHFAQLERLNKALSRAEDLARELADIG